MVKHEKTRGNLRIDVEGENEVVARPHIFHSSSNTGDQDTEPFGIEESGEEGSQQVSRLVAKKT